ncbi:pyridoxal-phosphate dependent enzyme [Pikeienuella piscinae]|uniref:Pyridoxal-phosphate dependent enzyme n=1 Tax=Pikeienuella piscinae TaxID=2748098 RepID=A0A7L5BUJ1_9RHOB|nr:serine/threonine dehydratase [Pikeienuella piscinae]QIE55485.1 pyridoxal-phosphate dependent enzyme [Pikeienuella piscinae]
MSVTLADILEAEAAIRPHVRRTPVMEVDPADFGIEWRGRISLKLECMQHTGSFKARGAFATLLTPPDDRRPAVAVSGGNHGAAVAYAAGALGLEATIFVPEYAPRRKLDRIRSYGPDLRVVGDTIAETMNAYRAHLDETGARAVHPYDAPLTVAGQGTVGLEWMEQAPDMDAVLVAIGGGGLISGVGVAMAAGPMVIGVEPVGAACAHEARRVGAPVEAVPTSFAKDSLGAPALGTLTHELIDVHVEDLVLVEDDAIRAAQAMLWRVCSVAAEPGGACALAALISGVVTPEPGAHIGVLVCGANFDLGTLPD